MSSKKSAKTQVVEANYQIKDIVLAKVKGYPPWPAMVIDPENVARHVKKERPQSKKTVFYCVRFFPAGDYSWAVAKDLSRLLPHEIEAYINEPSKKNSELKRGYEIALNPGAWEEDLIRKEEEAEAALAEEEEHRDQLEEESEGEDEVASDADSTTAKKKKKSQAGKKRKRDSVAADDTKKKRKSATETSAKRRPLAGTKKASKTKASSTEQIESEDGGAGGDGDESADAVPKKTSAKGSRSKVAADADERPAKKGKKDKEDDDVEDSALANDPEANRVKEWRHRLQRGFLSNQAPNPMEMPQYDQIFQIVESKELTIDYLQYSKIGKVMRRIASSNDVPRDDEFHFKDRATALVHKWQAIIQAAEQEAKSEDGGKQANGAKTAKKTSKSPPTESQSGATANLKATINGTANGAADTEMANGDARLAEVDAGKDDMDTSDS